MAVGGASVQQRVRGRAAAPGPEVGRVVRPAAPAKPNLEAGQDQPGVLRVAVGVARAVTKTIRAVTGAAGWLVDLWRQADQHTNHRHGRSPSTTSPTGEAMPRSPAAGSTSTWRPL